MTTIKQLFISAGGNRHPNAADWKGGALVFGSGHNVAIWKTSKSADAGIETLLRGHTDHINAVRLLSRTGEDIPALLSGSSDKTVRLWTWQDGRYQESARVSHDGSVNTISVLPDKNLVVTGAADGTLRVWSITDSTAAGSTRDATTADETGTNVRKDLQLLQTIPIRPRFLPLATALITLDDGSTALAVAGTTPTIQVYIQQDKEFSLAATLSGHEGWVRSLDFTKESTSPGSDILLASASQDKYIRLWRLNRGQDLPTTSTASQDPSLGILGKSLSNKPHYIGQGASLHSITFEALLIGSEDWIYTAQWKLGSDGPELLTTSADNSVSVWKRQADSGYWICETRLGEISAQKGSTTATGSAGGFWIGLWSPDGDRIASLGRTGSWRMWDWVSSQKAWEPRYGIGGHVKEVKGISWASDGSYLLSTGSDQTTRLLAQWQKGADATWHELARPQIHGYDLNCVDTLGTRQFISGADEKLLRVFNMSKASAQLISNLSGSIDSATDDLPESANIPVLGLSNKAIADEDREDTNGDVSTEEQVKSKPGMSLDKPPLEDQLARHTLWPEHEKLYGHGYEISAVAASHDGKLVATACRASSIDHAVIRLYETTDWREIRPPLSGHNLTVTSLAFSPDNSKLLSVGRDRQWMLYERESDDSTVFKLSASNPKGHSRMILDCSWAPSTDGDIFATAGRDKNVKIWRRGATEAEYTCKATIPTAVAATAVRFNQKSQSDGNAVLAWGTEEGEVAVGCLDVNSWIMKHQMSLAKDLRPAGAINALRWRPQALSEGFAILAAASDDCSVRLYNVHVDSS
ncbi:putative elongator complex protein-1 [Elsinoe australis]|uniref:Elongator complex protein 2 n=1 Tax=Elsinoe australis TaxID=40998 RepID=A0A4U7AUE3_9PEZI|nr:putative elongator complex protein-1 [Elsinoe australis]